MTTELQRVLAQEGFYIVTDGARPGEQIPMFVKNGKLFGLGSVVELDADAEKLDWAGVRFHGPFRPASELNVERSTLNVQRSSQTEDEYRCRICGSNDIRGLV